MQEDTRSRFDRVVEARKSAQQREVAKTTVESVEDHKQSQRAAWTSGGSRSAGGFVLDPETARLRDAAVKSRVASKVVEVPTPQSQELSSEEEEALALAWVSKHPEFPVTQYNAEVMEAIVRALKVPVTFAAFDQAFSYGTEHNHFESVRRVRGDRAPVPFTAQSMKGGK